MNSLYFGAYTYRFFIFLHSSRHLQHSPINCSKINQFRYFFIPVYWHGLVGINSPSTKRQLAHAGLPASANERVRLQTTAKIPEMSFKRAYFFSLAHISRRASWLPSAKRKLLVRSVFQREICGNLQRQFFIHHGRPRDH